MSNSKVSNGLRALLLVGVVALSLFAAYTFSNQDQPEEIIWAPASNWGYYSPHEQA